jgi:hypothetical protein
MGYSPVYSSQFIVYTADTPNELFDVPEGYTAIVREILGTQDIGGYAYNVEIADGAGAPYCVIYQSSTLGIFESDRAERRVVVPGGGSIKLNISAIGDSPSFYVGGYLLTNTLS